MPHSNQAVVNLAERHRHILDKLKKEGQVTVPELCDDLSVSSVTIRKDLKVLELKDLLFRTHGGASLINPYTPDRHVSEKEKINTEEKAAIAKAAAALLEPKDCIIIGSGTTVLALATEIKHAGKITVLTAALNVATELNRHPDVEVMVLGGLLRKSSASGTGIYAEQMLNDFSCSKCFLGVDAIDMEFGLSATHVMEAQLNRKMIQAAQRTIVLADSSKFGRKGFRRICNLEDIDMIITDDGISAHMEEQIREMGIELIIATA